MRFIHTADLHLDAPVGTLPQRAAVRRGALEALAQMITYAKANEIKYMVIAGDLFDTPTPSPALCGAVEKMFDGAKEILFLICAGNHDAMSAEGDWCHMTLGSNVKLFGREIEQVCTSEGSFVGAGFYEGMMRHPLGRLPEKSGITVGVFHGSIGDTEPAYRIEAEAVRQSGLDYLALGHIHKPSDPVKMGDTVVATSGSPASHGFDEPGKRSFLDVTVEPAGVSASRVFLNGIEFYEDQITVEEADTQSDILGKMTAMCASHGERDIYRFRVSGVTACVIPETLPDYPALVEVINETTLPLSLDKLAEEQSLKGYFVKAMLEQIASASEDKRQIYEAALRLGLEAFE